MHLMTARENDLDQDLDDGMDTGQPPVDEYDEAIDAPETDLTVDDLDDPDEDEDEDLE